MTSPLSTLRPPTDLRRALASPNAPSDVREAVRASWQRSLASGVTRGRLDVPFEPTGPGDGALARTAAPVLDELATDLAGVRLALVLANQRCQVLDRRVTDPWLGPALDRIGLAPGYVHAEDAVGTNGIGTAVAQRSPAFVTGNEHYAAALAGVASAAAPIVDPRNGRIIGVLGLMCPADEANPLMLPIATRGAREIEQRLLDDAGVSERLLLQRFLQERRRAKGPVVLITDRTMVTNAAADRLVTPDDEPRLRACADRYDEVSEVVLASGVAATVRSEPIGDGRGTALLRLTAAGDEPRGARPTFGWDSLTDTERSVTALVAEGLTNREAAERLFLSPHTVGFHLRSIYRKVGVASRVDLTRAALEHGLAPDATFTSSPARSA